MTSKISTLKCLDSLKTYGFHGEALCNIIHLSDQVEIIIKTKNEFNNSDEFFKKEFTFKSYSSDQYAVNIYKIDSKDNFSTLVRVKNIFGKFPIRQKQLNESKNVKSLRKQLEILSLINFDVEFCLEILNEKRILFHSSAHSTLIERFSNLIGLKSNDQSIKHFFFNDNNYLSFEIDGYIYLYSKIGINNNFDYNLNTSVSSKYQFIFVNNKYIQNSDFYDLIASKLSSCKEFNILNSDPKQTVFCLVIKASPVFFKIVSLKNKKIAEFHNKLSNQIVKDLLLKFVENFLIEFGFKKLDFTKINYNFNRENFENPCLLLEDLKNSRASKTFKANVKKEKDENFQANKYLLRKDDLKFVLKNSLKKSKSKKISSLTKPDKIIALESTFETMFNQNKLNFIGENCLSNSRSSKSLFDLVTKEMGVLCKRDNWLNLKFKNKSTQTTSVSKCKQSSKQKDSFLKENWIVETNDQGVEYFINLIDGTSTYDFNVAKREVFSNSSNSLIEDFLSGFFFSAINNDMIGIKSSLIYCNETNRNKSESLNDIKTLIEQMSLVKWRNQQEYFDKRLSSQENFNFDDLNSSIKINRKYLENLNVTLNYTLI